MKFKDLHPWDVAPKEAVAIQHRLREDVIREDAMGPVRRVAGVDVGFEDNGAASRAAVVVLEFPGLDPVESVIARLPTTFPYVPGLLSFRELPVVLKAFEKLQHLPDLALCDGQGIAHPRRLGIACHLGLVTSIPAIGVGKTRLVGTYVEPGNSKGEWKPLRDKEETIGAVLRTRPGVKPLFVSCGHKVSLKTAVKYVLDCTTRYKLPETTRYAHRLASGE